ncbi:MAG: hypothetical protein WCS21_08030 [Lachnospiraceae bacterium]
MRKRLFSFILSVVLVMNVAGTSVFAAQAQASAKAQTAAKQAQASAKETTAAAASAKATTTQTAAKQAQAAVLPASQAGMVTSLWNGDNCTNYWSNVSFTLPAGWLKLTSDQIATAESTGLNVITNNLSLTTGTSTTGTAGTAGTATAAGTGAMVTDYYLMNSTGTASFSSQIIDRNAAGVLNMTPEEYLGQIKAVMESLTSLNLACSEAADDSVAGTEAKTMGITLADSNGTPVILEAITVEQIGQFLVMYISATSTTDGANELISLWNQIG